MTVQATSVTVATTATALNVAEPSVVLNGLGVVMQRNDAMVTVLLRVPAGGVTVYVGGADVTTATGYPVAAGDALALDLAENEVVYGVVASSTQAVNVIRTGV
jgi:hypothetical protein